ncbi:MAG: nitroreductase/quinone reductase family protein [Mycobacterium sp.]
MRLNQARVAHRSNWVVRRYPRVQRAIARLHARLYVHSGGRFLPRWFGGAPVMVLETVGRRSGRERATPLLYLRDADASVVLAANAGAARTPAWWLNLQAAGEGEVHIGRRRLPIKPRLLGGRERDRLWQRYVQMYPQAELYTRFTDRGFPLVALEPA